MRFARMMGCWWMLMLVAGAQSQRLPVFLADNHAESFAWMSRMFDPDDSLLMVLVDAHTDASAAERSEEMREQTRRVPSIAARAQRIEAWRASGRLQAFNWIEPLMPRPIERVVWVPKMELAREEAVKLTADAVGALDGRLEVEPRGAGSFAGRWQTMSMLELEGWAPDEFMRVVVSIDLDFFSGMESAAQGKAMERIWRRAMDWPGLVGVCFAVSRPWLQDADEADALVQLATALVARTRGAKLEVDASLDDRPDVSLRANELAGASPRWDAAAASPGLVQMWHNMAGKLKLTDRVRDWDGVFSESMAHLSADVGEMDCDGVWRFEFANAPVIRVRGVSNSTGRVRWFALRAARKAYDFLPQTKLGKAFSESPGRWIYEERSELGETHDFALAPAVWTPCGPGRLRIEAEVETPRGWLPVAAMEIRLSQGSGFRGILSECLNMPYGFGIAVVEEDDLEVVESGWAADCSNVLIYAWRKLGVSMRWGDPGVLRDQLETVVENAAVSSLVKMSPEMIDSGLIVDFGRHVAAVWEDNEPFGVLDNDDLVFHHLGGYPEIVPLSVLVEKHPVFSVRKLPDPMRRIAIKIAGDVVMANEDRIVVDGFEKGEVDLFLVNLEGVPSMRNPQHAGRYDFRFPPERLAWLRKHGVDAVSLANNHAGDAGLDGLHEGMAAIRAAGLGSMGAGENEAEACRPWVADGRVAVFGVSILDGMIATADAPGIAHLPTHQSLLEHEMRAVLASGFPVVVLLHGGDEYRHRVNDSQRLWVRWLVRRGARVVVGSHPHVVQRSEFHGGAEIHYSLGNAVYPAVLSRAGSGNVKTVHIEE